MAMSDAIYTLQSGQKLNSGKFCKYIYKKLEKTAKKFDIIIEFQKKNKVYCLDDAAIDVIYGLMSNKSTKLKKSPYIFCLKKELELYSKLRGIKFEFPSYSSLKLKIQEMLDSFESKHKEIKYSIVKAQLQVASMI